MQIEWVGDLPPSKPRTTDYVSKYDRIAQQLQTRPGSWANVGEYASRAAARYAAKELQRRSCDTEYRRTDEGVAVFARFSLGAEAAS